jgi:hypothetical protein
MFWRVTSCREFLLISLNSERASIGIELNGYDTFLTEFPESGFVLGLGVAETSDCADC